MCNAYSTTINKTSTKGVCRNGFGFKGICLNGTDKLDQNKIPSAIQSVWHKILQPIIKKSPFAPSLCFGDFSPTEFGAKFGLKTANCNHIPLDSNSKYGSIAFSVSKVPCGKPVTVNVCAVFDRCGTVAISINGGVLACIAATTGIGAVFSAVSGSIQFAQFGFSYHKKFKLPVSVVIPNGTGVQEKTVSARGHFYVGLGFTIPKDWLKISKKVDLSKYIKIKGEAKMLVNFGRVGATITKMIDQIKNMNSSTAGKLVKTLLSSGAEIAVTLKGTFTILLDKLSKGFFPNLVFDINTSLIITTGNSDTGLALGLYVKVQTNVISKLLGCIRKVYDRFAVPLRKLGIPVPNFPSGNGLDITLGLYVTKAEMGFLFKILGQNIRCALRFRNFDASCEIGGGIFTAIADAVKWVFKSAKKLFDKAGKAFLNVAQGVGKFAANSAKAGLALAKKGVAAARKVAGKIIGGAKRTFNNVKNAAKKVFNSAKALAVKTFNNVVAGIRKAAKAALEAARRAAQRIRDAAARAARKAKRWFSSWAELESKSDKAQSESYEALESELEMIKSGAMQSESQARQTEQREIQRAQNQYNSKVNAAQRKLNQATNQANKIISTAVTDETWYKNRLNKVSPQPKVVKKVVRRVFRWRMPKMPTPFFHHRFRGW